MIHWISQLQRICSIPDGILVARAKHGNRDAFGKLYTRYITGIYRYCYFHMNKNTQHAEDMTQTVFIKAWEHLEQFDGKNMNAWLFTIARNMIIDHFRTDKRTEPLRETIPHEVGGEQLLDTLAIQDVVGQALDKVSREQKTVILLRFVEGFSPVETARIMGKTPQSVRAMQYRTLKELRKLIQI